MKNIFAALTLFLSIAVHGQYYYNDIVGTQDITNRMKTYIANKVQSVTATGYDQRGAKTQDFNEWQEVQQKGTILKVTNRDGQAASRTYYTFDGKTRLLNIRDSSAGAQSSTDYQYDGQDRIISMKTTTQDAGQDFNATEERQYQYGGKGKPVKMLRIINGNDSIEYTFTADEKGNISDEQPTRRRVGIGALYYYYDDKNRLTDIVRFDKYSQQLLPDVMLEYDDSDRVIQRVTTLSTRPPDYLIWRYIFDEKGLKVKEAMFGKSDGGLSGETSSPKGRIEYAYVFSN